MKLRSSLISLLLLSIPLSSVCTFSSSTLSTSYTTLHETSLHFSSLISETYKTATSKLSTPMPAITLGKSLASLPRFLSTPLLEASITTSEIQKLPSSECLNIPSQGVVVVDYYAMWCGPCRRMMPIFEAVAKSHSNTVQFFTCEATDEVFEKLHIKTIPCIILYKDGVEIARTGSQTEAGLIRWITTLSKK